MKKILPLLLFVAAIQLQAQEILWHDTPSELMYFPGKYICSDDDNNVYVASTTPYYDGPKGIKIQVYDANGNPQLIIHDTVFNGLSGMKLSNNRIILVGGTTAENNKNDIMVKIYNTDGSLYYQYQYDYSSGDDWPTDLSTDESGNIYLCGTVMTDTQSSLIVMKFDSELTPVWSQVFGKEDEFIYGAHLSLSGNSKIFVSIFTHTPNDIGVLSFSLDGELLSECYSDIADITYLSAKSMAVDNDEKAYLVGHISFYNQPIMGFIICMQGASVLWTDIIESGWVQSTITDIECNVYGNIAVCGYYPSENGSAYIAHYSNTGVLLSENHLGNYYSEYDVLYDIAFSNGFVYAAGAVTSGDSKRDMLITCSDSTCEFVWAYPIDGFWSNDDIAYKLCFDNKDNIIVTGSTTDTNYIQYCTTLKLSNPLSIDEAPVEFKQLSIYPNPVSNVLNLNMDWGNSETLTYNIYNVSGQLLISEEHNSTSILLNNLSAGIYFLEVVEVSDHYYTKFVKQ